MKYNLILLVAKVYTFLYKICWVGLGWVGFYDISTIVGH